ncbi:hypothetical protein [Nocardia suismassiliense]|uniref:hypothetical protein n=1 Tax=Nocardia suismassiliense TaxID=2077092 RepID=UPI00131F3A46|nr:hypothetical protein [Nocardia suismassiliense]
MDNSEIARRSAWFNSVALAMDNPSADQTGDYGTRVHNFHRMTPTSAGRLLQRLDARKALSIVTEQIAASNAAAAPVISSTLSEIKPVSAVTGLGAPPVSPEQQIQDNKDRLEENKLRGNQAPPPSPQPVPPAQTNPTAPVQNSVPQNPSSPAPTPATTRTDKPVDDKNPPPAPPLPAAPTTGQPATASPNTTDPLIEQLLGTTGAIEQPHAEVGSLPWILAETKKPPPQVQPPPVVNTATADVTVQPSALASPTQAELDAGRVERILPDSVGPPERGGTPVEWTDGNGTQGSLRIDEYGQRHWRFLQSNGRLIEVTEGGGSDGGDRPWTHTKITEAEQRTPRVDTYGTTGVTAYVDTTDGVDTRYLRFQGGDFGIEEHHGGSDGQDRPWSKTTQATDNGDYITTKTQNGTRWQSPAVDDKIHTRYVGNDGTRAEQVISLNPWEPGWGYVTLPGGVTQSFTTRDGAVTGGRYTANDGTGLGAYQVVNGVTTFFASPENIAKNWNTEGITALRVEIGPDGKPRTYYRVVNVPDEQVRDGQPGDLPGWVSTGSPEKGPAFEGLRNSINVLGDVVGERLVGPFITLSHPVATSQGLMFVPYKPPPDKQHTPGEVFWAVVDILTVATLFLPVPPIAPLLSRAALAGRTALTGTATAGRAVLSGAAIVGKAALSGTGVIGGAALAGTAAVGRAVLTGAGSLGRPAIAGLQKTISAGAARLGPLNRFFGSGLDDAAPVLVRHDNNFSSTVNDFGRTPLKKSYIDDGGNLVPANKDGNTEAWQHILGGKNKAAKEDSPYTSFSVKDGSGKVYGSQEIAIDVGKLQKAIDRGDVHNAQILSPKEVQASLQQEINRLAKGQNIEINLPVNASPDDVKRFVDGQVHRLADDGITISRKDGERLIGRVQAMLNTRRDNEWLIKGIVPQKFIKGPYNVTPS